MASILLLLLTAFGAEAATDRLGDDAGLGVSADGRLLLKYTVQCALPKGDHVLVRRDGRDIILSGSLGLAPQWKRAPMTAIDQRWMTACILARMNAFGVTVKLSLRADHDALRRVDSAERRRYTYDEGAFYGNLFADPPVLYACSGAGGASRAPTKRLRVCTQPPRPGETENRCGMTMTGACAEVCETQDGIHRRCLGGGTRYDEVLTVFLETSRR